MASKQKPLSFSLHPLNHAYIERVVSKQKETNHRYNRSMYMDDLITHLRTKAEAKPKTELVVVKKKKVKTELVPTEVHGLNLEAWADWIAFRKKVKFKAYKTDATMKSLAEMGNHAEQALIVKNSIKLEYQGLFPLKKNNSAATKQEHDDILNDTSWADNLDDVL